MWAQGAPHGPGAVGSRWCEGRPSLCPCMGAGAGGGCWEPRGPGVGSATVQAPSRGPGRWRRCSGCRTAMSACLRLAPPPLCFLSDLRRCVSLLRGNSLLKASLRVIMKSLLL